jgi:5'-3' exonuclease
MRLHVVDGTFELFRAHFSKRPDRRLPTGEDVKATVGVVWSMIGLLEDRDEQVTHLAVAFDNPIWSFRNEIFPGYKTEEGVAPELLAQFDRVEEALKTLGIVVWSMERWEADDALATAAARFADQVEQVRILTPDKDLGQAIRGTHVVQVDRMRRRVVDEDALFANRGIRPPSVPDFLALVGDDADGIPGVPGFGERTAAALLRAFHHLEGIPEHPAAWPPDIRGAWRLAGTLRDMREEALLYRRLATLVTDVPLMETLADLEWRGVLRGPFDAWCAAYEVRELTTRPMRWTAGPANGGFPASS